MPDTIKLADIKIREGFNARENGWADTDIEELAGSVGQVGVLQPVTLDAEGYLVAGHRRVAAAKLKGLTEVPYRVEQGDEKHRLAVHGAENTARKNLSPAEEAGLIERMIDPKEGGFTLDGAAEVLGMSKALVTRRTVLLKMPSELRALWGPHGSALLDAAPLVAEIVEKIPQLAPLILQAEKFSKQEREPRTPDLIEALRDKAYEEGLDDDAYLEDDDSYDEWFGEGDPPKLAELVRDPRQYMLKLVRAYTVSGDEKPPKGTLVWPKDVVVFSAGVELRVQHLNGLKCTKKQLEKFGETSEQLRAAGLYWDVKMMLDESDLDAARAAGVLVALGDYEFVFDQAWLKARVASDMLPRFAQNAAAAIEAAKERTIAMRAGEKKGPRPDSELSSAELQAKEKARRTREKEKEWKGRAEAVNQQLGAALLNKWGEVKVDPTIAKIFAEASLGRRPPANSGYGDSPRDRPAAQLAAGGLRYVMAGWPTVVSTPTKANPAKTRTDYLPIEEAEARLWKWFDQAKTVEEIFGRAVVIHAAAMWANEHVLAQSHRVSFHACGTVVLPYDVGERLRKLVEKTIPAQVKKLAKEIEDFKS